MWPSSFDHHERHWAPKLSAAGPPLLGSPQSVSSCRPYHVQNGLMQNLQALISGNWQDFQLLLMTPALHLLQVASVVALIGERCKRSWPRHYLCLSCSRKAPPPLLFFCPLLPSTFSSSCHTENQGPWHRVPQRLQSLHHTPPCLPTSIEDSIGHYGAAYCRLSNLGLLRPALLMHCLLTTAAMSQMASLRRLILLAFDVAVIFPGKKPLWPLATSRGGYIVHLQLSMTALAIS